jgi:hypothetical protein
MFTTIGPGTKFLTVASEDAEAAIFYALALNGAVDFVDKIR